MSQKNVVEVLRRISDGKRFEVLFVTLQHARMVGHRFVRIGPHGEHRSKRRWISIDEALSLYEPEVKGEREVRR